MSPELWTQIKCLLTDLMAFASFRATSLLNPRSVIWPLYTQLPNPIHPLLPGINQAIDGHGNRTPNGTFYLPWSHRSSASDRILIASDRILYSSSAGISQSGHHPFFK